ncbi:hypothetical protein GCM10027447_18330 [Glycomyces halotolerans]
MQKANIIKSLAAASVISMVAFTPAAATAQEDHENGTFSTMLDPLNNTPGSGHATVDFHGDEATITVSYSGLAETFQDGPFPHAQHIHIDGQGRCPDMSRDENGDGVVSTPEGQPDYGGIGTSLTTEGDTSPDSALAVERFPGGPANDYSRTFTLDKASAESVRNGTGVIVVHGVDPATMSDEAAEAKSPLDDSLPLAATAPALCGALASGMPDGGADTGGGYLAGSDGSVTTIGAVLAAAGALIAAAYAWRRRKTAPAAS